MNRKVVKESLIGLVMGVGMMFAAIYLIPKETAEKVFPDSKIESVIFFISVFVCPFFAIFLHELGHLIAGLVHGFKIQLFVVAFFGMKREDDKVKIYFNKDLNYFGGVAATSPQKITNELKRQFAQILIAGPLFSVIFGLLFILIFVYTDTIFNSSFGIIGITSIGLFFATTLPEKSGIFFTDRKRMQRLFDKGIIGEIEKSYIETTSQLLIDNHYKNISIAKLKLIQSDTEPIVQFWGHYFEFKHYQETENLEESSTIKEKLYSYQQSVPKSIWKSLTIE
jgi:hypothetical protein